MRETLKNLLDSIKKKTEDFFFAKEHRLLASAFTRERKLSVKKIIFMKLDVTKQSNNSTIYNISNDVFCEKAVKRQSFEEARSKLSYTAFAELFKDSAKTCLEFPEGKLYKGYRLLAVDGTTQRLPNAKELLSEFGKSTPVKGSVYCRISICADVLNESVVEGEIAGYDVGERVLARRHLEKITCENALYIFDRGYWDKAFFRLICEKQQKFLVRVQSNHAPQNCEGEFIFEGKYKLRYHKFLLKSGQTEHLITNLGLCEVSTRELEKLYALRWGVETRYNELKNQLGMLTFSGKSTLIVKQDFYAFLTVMNLIACALYDADELVCARNEGKSLKHKQKINKSLAVNILKIRYLRAVFENDPQKRQDMFAALIADISDNLVPIRPNRHFPRLIYSGKKKLR